MRLTSILVSTALLAAAGCGGSSPASPSDVAKGTAGTLNVRITDSPFSAARAVLLTFSEVAVQRGSDWTKVPFPEAGATTWMCDLKKLENNTEDLLATSAMPLTNFTMVRVMVQSAIVYTDATSTTTTPCARTIATPSGGAFPMKLESPEGRTNGTFSITAGGSTTVVVDFDGESSITRPNPADYRLNTVLRLAAVR
jgi:hypothetical protein